MLTWVKPRECLATFCQRRFWPIAVLGGAGSISQEM
jgi:hypothetical protein